MTALLVVWLVCGWFLAGFGGLWVIWVVFGWFGWLAAGLWMVCWWFGWLVGSLAGFWVVWLICGWFRVFQLTERKTKVVNTFGIGKEQSRLS